MAFFTENYNQDFAAQNMVYVLGSGESVEPIPGYSMVTFDDVTGGGYTYAALQCGWCGERSRRRRRWSCRAQELAARDAGDGGSGLQGRVTRTSCAR